MTKAKAKTTAKTADYTAQVKEGFADLQGRAKTAYDKGTELASDMGEFNKANVEAVVESGKILAAGMQDMGKVMGLAKAQIAGQADMGVVSQTVKSLLS